MLIHMPNARVRSGSRAAAVEVLDVQLSGKPLPHAAGVSAPGLRPSTPRHMCIELSRCYHALARLCAPPPLSLPGLLSD